ncbi:MAG: sigma-54-dependent Fis family transcriptional regulator, partial [Acidobacteria bacterium]|nr:sigma-54-dependent Fis family transcriptional regulator [Acidobacteriota bacterium]
MPRLLLISREPTEAVRPLSGRDRFSLDQVSSGLEAVQRLDAGASFDLVLLDLLPGDDEALHALRWIEKLRPDLPVILLLSDSKRAPEAEKALCLARRENVRKPVSEQELERLIEHHLAPRTLHSHQDTSNPDIEHIGDEVYFVAASPAMRKIRAQAELLAKVDVPILITGENASGKKVLAQLIHKLSARSPHRFARLNCAALSADVLENELFGPSGTGSPGTSAPGGAGSLELCHKGTIVLDDFTEMPARLQAKLLGVLQEKHLFRLE